MPFSLAFCRFVISKSSPEPVKSTLPLVTFSQFKISKRSFLVLFLLLLFLVLFCVFFPSPFPASFSHWFVTQQCQFTSGTNRTNLSFGLDFTNSLVLGKHILCPSLPDAHAAGERQGLLKVLPLFFCTISNISSPSVFFYKGGLLGSLSAASPETPPRPGFATRP